MSAALTAPAPDPGRWWLRLCLVALPLAVWLAQAMVPEAPIVVPAALVLPLHMALAVSSIVLAAIAVTLLRRKPANASSLGGAALTASLSGAAVLVFLQAMSHAGMPALVTPSGVDKSTAFGLAARALLAAGLLAIALLPPQRRSRPAERRAALGLALLAVLAVSAFTLGLPAQLPIAMRPGNGPSAAIVAAESLLALLFVFAAFGIGRKADHDGPVHYEALTRAALFAGAGALCLASHRAPDDTLTVLGDTCFAIAYYGIARAAYVVAVREPMRQFETFAQALNATQHPSLLCDRDGRVRWVNRAFERASGWRAPDIAGQPLAALAPTGDAAPLDPSLAAIAAGRAWHGQVEVCRRDRSRFIESRSVTPIERDDGRITGFVVVGEDVTERIAVQRQLAEREQTYRALMDTATDGVWIVDAAGRILEANEAYARRSGWPRECLAGMHVADLDALQDTAGVTATLASIVARGHLRFETEHRARHGEHWPVEVSVNHGAHGGGRFFVFLRDLTQRRIAEQTLREREAKLSGLFELSPVGIALCRMDGTLVEFNAAYRRLTGHDAETLRGLSYWDLTPPDHLAAEQALLPQIAREGRYGPHEKEYLRADGSRVPVRLNGVRLLIRGEPHIWSIVEDLTPTHALESERRRLQHQQMQSQKLEALGQLAGGIAHDFNNMLAGMLGLASLALDHHAHAPDAVPGRYLGEIVRTCERGRDLVAKLLAYGRAPTDEPVQPRDVGTLVGEMHEMLARSLPRGLRLALHVEPGAPPVRIHAVDVQQIVMNLVLNARDAIDQHGRIDITLAGAQIDGSCCSACGAPVAGRHLVLTVRDDGAGIPEPLQAKVFDPFFTTKGVGRGTGLGLSTVLGIVHKAGGHLQLRSSPGAGTSMRVLLPAALTPVPQAAAPASPPPDGSALEVWVVDDDPTVRLLLVEVLATHDHVVRAFEDPREVLPALATGTRPAVLVTDQTMPGLSGIDLASAVLARYPGVAVILCTGYSEQVDEQAALARGVAAYLRKPFHPRTLLDAVARAAGCTVRAPG